jgi:hypothetical protein
MQSRSHINKYKIQPKKIISKHLVEMSENKSSQENNLKQNEKIENHINNHEIPKNEAGKIFFLVSITLHLHLYSYKQVYIKAT